jgi:ureidoglycolate lyase
VSARVLFLTPLTKAAFEPFGTVIEVDGAQSYPINEGTTTRFHKLATADTGTDNGAPIISMFRGSARPQPIELRMMERHPISSQAFYPLSADDWLVVVADDVETPGPEDLHGFRARGNQGVQYARNVWHHPLLTLASVQDFLIVDRAGSGDNLEELWFPDGDIATIEA